MQKIFVVDDERDVVELLSFVLKKDGYDVSFAYNGKEALEMLGLMEYHLPPETPDLIILDVMMPEIDGFTVQNKLAENAATSTIPIIILTAKGQMRDLFGMAPNVAAYVEKPFDPQIIRAKVKEILKKK